MKTPVCGEWYLSDTSYGPMIHARLAIAEENSGKLVTLVRNQARKYAKESGNNLIIVDGPPGIGCPVISSLSGADLVLAVTEPTIAGQHDLRRLGELTQHFNIPTVVCINKWDINPELTQRIEDSVIEQNMKVIGKIHYDDVFTRAQMSGIPVAEYSKDGIVSEIKELWDRVCAETGITAS
jgi:MinD superfamily P-loop ATPase